jgi:D-sedoheptulose 7-phosphate isomerase
VSYAETIRLYLDEQRRILELFPVDVVVRATDQLFATYDAGGTVYALANGGNAGTLDHCYVDFRHHPFVSSDKRAVVAGARRLRFVNLSGSPAELTGLVNDLGPEQMYAAGLGPELGPDDLVMAYSGSGNSSNVVRALEVAASADARTFAMTRGTGGRCRELADVCLVVPGTSRFPGQTGGNDNNFHFEDVMLSVNHILVGLLKQRLGGD